MIDVDCADMCSNQRGLPRKISRVENGVTVYVIGLPTQMDGGVRAKGLGITDEEALEIAKKKTGSSGN